MDRISIPIKRTAHVFTLGKPGKHIRQFWVACHGYAQLASEFAEDLKVLEDEKTLVVCPEGTNYFYKKGFSGPVGANWMTRHFREEAIADNAAYLQAVYDHFLPLLEPDVKIVLLGFSQGTATICRWIMEKFPHFHSLVLWAGLPPDDLDYKAHAAYLSDKSLYLLYGTNDPFLTDDRISTVSQIEKGSGIDFESRAFAGGHEIPKDVLQKLRGNLHLS